MKFISSILLTIFFLLEETRAEQENIAYDGTSDGGLGSDDEIILLFIFLFFAFCVSIFGSFLLYVTYLDDLIMKLYRAEGNIIEGEVVRTEFSTNPNDDIGIAGNQNIQKRHVAAIEYSIIISETYPLRIRKLLRVLECDLFPQDQHRDISSRNKNNQNVFDDNTIRSKAGRVVEILVSRDSFFKSCQFDQGRKLPLLVLPNQPLSALPARQVERRLSARYRFSSMGFVIAAILVAVFCFRLATPLLAHMLHGEDGTETRGYVPSITGGSAIFDSLLMNIFFATLALSPTLCIHHLFYDFLQYSLEKEYFETGADVIKGDQDDSSLSTWSDFRGHSFTTNDYFFYSRMDLEIQ